jgi:hypothetical protein
MDKAQAFDALYAEVGGRPFHYMDIAMRLQNADTDHYADYWVAGRVLAMLLQLGGQLNDRAVPPMPKRVMVDFDGVLYSGPWEGASNLPAPPVPGAIEWLKELLADQRFTVSIFSARCTDPLGRVAVIMWLRRNGLTDTDKLSYPVVKTGAHVYIDDRAMPFTGTFPTPDMIDEFTPWNASQ